MRTERLVPVLLLASVLGGCVMGPDYHRPDIAVPDTYRPLTENTSPSALDSRWWESFGDPVLNGMVLQAVRNNRNLKVALANSEKAAAAIMQARSELFPQVGLDARTTRERLSERNAEPVVGVANPQNNRQASLSASWELDLWGRIRRLTESADADAR